jgi:16S rRNA (adenine1518-N6/adenine1519-N6)-dimethyltransferase
MVSIREIQPKKSLGQNFLSDENIARKIVAALTLKPSEAVLEIGSGTGILTKFLLQTDAAVVAVEIDKRLSAILKEQFPDQKNLLLVNEDFLNLTFDKFIDATKNWKVVGNLPYFITSQVLFKIFASSHLFEKAVFMMQKEVAQRIVAQPHSKQYGILSVQSQFYSEVKKLFDVSRKVFFPEPEVNSSVVEFKFFSNSGLTDSEEKIFRLVVRKVFSQRRKMLRNSLKLIEGINWKLSQLNFNLEQRPEQLTVKDFIKLSQQIARLQ